MLLEDLTVVWILSTFLWVAQYAYLTSLNLARQLNQNLVAEPVHPASVVQKPSKSSSVTISTFTMAYNYKGKGQGYQSGGNGRYGAQSQRGHQSSTFQTKPPSWCVESASSYTLEQYHKDVREWYRSTTSLDTSAKMDLIVNQLQGTAAT